MSGTPRASDQGETHGPLDAEVLARRLTGILKDAMEVEGQDAHVYLLGPRTIGIRYRGGRRFEMQVVMKRGR